MLRLRKASNLLELTFPRSTLVCASAAVLGVLISGSRDLIQILFAGVAFSLISATFFSLDSLVDIETDRVSRPDRPLPSGRVGYAQARMLALLLFLSCLGVLIIYGSFTVNLIPLTLSFTCLMLVVFYSIPPRLSEVPLLSNGIVASLFTVFPILTGWTISRPIEEAPLSIIVAVFLLAWGDMEDFVDLEGDRYRGTRTLPIALGEKAAGAALAGLCFSSLLVGFLDLLATRRFYWLITLPLQATVFLMTASLVESPSKEQIRFRHTSSEVLVFATGVILGFGYMLIG
jgi:geranylgeranylglycerol-phosphate geranylgeranyltransferase